MRTLIITDNLRKAEFVKKGLKYESLAADVVSIDDQKTLSNYISFYNGIFILSENSFKINQTVNMCLLICRTVPMVILTGGFHPELTRLKEGGFVKNIFIRPYSFGGIASEMRYFIYQLKDRDSESRLIIRDLELDLTRHEVRLGKRPVNLRHREFALLHFLMMNTGKVLSRTTILENVWDRNASISTNTVDVHISQLRKKLDKTFNQKYIYTIPCSGYLLS